MIKLMRELRDELTEALSEHLFDAGAARFKAQYPTLNPYPDLLSEARARQYYYQCARDCMDFMYGDLAELYPEPLSHDGHSEGSEPLPDPRG